MTCLITLSRSPLSRAKLRELRFDSSVTLEHFEIPLPDYPLEEYARTYPFQYDDDELPDLAQGLRCHYPSHYVAGWAEQFLDPSGSIGTIELLRSMTSAIKRDFRYQRRSEKGIQSPGETLQCRRGSCRDFALLMIEAVRCLGFAARFVSGYIFVPDRDDERDHLRRRDPRLDAGVPAGRGMGGLRPHQ